MVPKRSVSPDVLLCQSFAFPLSSRATLPRETPAAAASSTAYSSLVSGSYRPSSSQVTSSTAPVVLENKENQYHGGTSAPNYTPCRAPQPALQHQLQTGLKKYSRFTWALAKLPTQAGVFLPSGHTALQAPVSSSSGLWVPLHRCAGGP
ncbi:hypothetical protein ABVT39_027162 [Epinephelus coioides]